MYGCGVRGLRWCVGVTPRVWQGLRLTAEVNERAKAAGDFAVDELHEDTIKAYVRHAAVELAPLCTMFGGLVGHELLKCTGTQTPLNGECH